MCTYICRFALTFAVVLGFCQSAYATWLNCQISGYDKSIFDTLVEKSEGSERSRRFFDHLKRENPTPIWTEQLEGLEFEGWRWGSTRDIVAIDNYSLITLPQEHKRLWTHTVELEKYPGFPSQDLRYSVYLQESDYGFVEVNLELTDWLTQSNASGSARIQINSDKAVMISISRLDGGLVNDDQLGRITLSCVANDKNKQAHKLD